jgi:hypothetical protein
MAEVVGAVAFLLLIIYLIGKSLCRRYRAQISIYGPLALAGVLVVAGATWFVYRVLVGAITVLGIVLSWDGFLWSLFGVGDAPAYAWAVRLVTWLLLLELVVGVKFTLHRYRPDPEEQNWLWTHIALVTSIGTGLRTGVLRLWALARREPVEPVPVELSVQPKPDNYVFDPVSDQRAVTS